MAPATDELIRLVEGLPEEERDELISELRERAEIRARGEIQLPGIRVHGTAHVSPPQVSETDEATAPGQEGLGRAAPGLFMHRWPHLGPAAVGAAVLLGWGAGIAAGPLAAIIGAVLGLVLGDRLDQHTAAAADA